MTSEKWLLALLFMALFLSAAAGSAQADDTGSTPLYNAGQGTAGASKNPLQGLGSTRKVEGSRYMKVTNPEELSFEKRIEMAKEQDQKNSEDAAQKRRIAVASQVQKILDDTQQYTISKGQAAIDAARKATASDAAAKKGDDGKSPLYNTNSAPKKEGGSLRIFNFNRDRN